MNGAELVIDFLIRKGVKKAFGYPGGPVIILYEAIYKYGFPHVLTRHEQGAVHAAEGYAKVSGQPGVCLATSGPEPQTWLPAWPTLIWIRFLCWRLPELWLGNQSEPMPSGS